MYLELVRPAHVRNNGLGHPSAIIEYTLVDLAGAGLQGFIAMVLKIA